MFKDLINYGHDQDKSVKLGKTPYMPKHDAYLTMPCFRGCAEAESLACENMMRTLVS
jgi:hypothetical protein